jgi:predicted CoA-substrate-specific enzyme activase
MFYAGVDVGSRTAKVVILNENSVAASHLIATGPDSAETSLQVLQAALNKVNLEMTDLAGIVTTGYGRYIAPFPHTSITEIACHTRGVHKIFRTARTILDMGGQDCKAIRLDHRGQPSNFVMNDKCAAGTGRFLEILARSLGVPLEEIGPKSLTAKGSITVSSMCAVFARQEAIAYRRRGAPLEDILAGVHEAVADRVFRLIKTVGLEPDFVITGGIAQNPGVVQRLEKRSRLAALIPPQPQYTGALGAAWLARENT